MFPGNAIEIRGNHLGSLIKSVTSELTGVIKSEKTVIKANVDKLLHGDLFFSIICKAWKNYLPENVICEYENVLEFYAYARKTWDKCENVEELTKKVSESLKKESEKWCLKIANCTLENQRFLIFLDRPKTITTIIQTVIQQNQNYGKSQQGITEKFHFQLIPDHESELTFARLRLLKNVCENIVRCQGHEISDAKISNNFVFTTSSNCKTDKDCTKVICGVVRNEKTKSKEIYISWEKYFEEKLKSIDEKSVDKVASTKMKEEYRNNVSNIANAVISLEMLAVKPNLTMVLAQNSDSKKEHKGATFVVYNAVRISAICQKFREKQKLGVYPKLEDIEKIDFSVLNQEEEWQLVSAFILTYPEVISSCLSFKSNFEFSPQYLCSFLFRLCQLFSAYYRKTRVLLEPYLHLLPLVMARMYLLKALNIVLQNSFELLNINSVTCM